MVEFLEDTGADRTLLSAVEAERMVQIDGIDLHSLVTGAPGNGIGGRAPVRLLDATLHLDQTASAVTRAILLPSPGVMSSIPSLLGRDVLSHFALFLEERTRRVLLLEPAEADALAWP